MSIGIIGRITSFASGRLKEIGNEKLASEMNLKVRIECQEARVGLDKSSSYGMRNEMRTK
ncbi:hypothetical protein KAW48_08385 [candidate division WOR-3 bacterium]|nr:hypothetical protein [candidate division WOR-3 bacterium]